MGLLDSAGNSLTSGTNFAVDITAPSITGITISNAATTIAKQGQKPGASPAKVALGQAQANAIASDAFG